MGMVIGGYADPGGVADTFFISKDVDNELKIVPGPLLNQSRYLHAAGKITDHGNSKVGIVVVGGWYEKSKIEVLWDLSPNGKWETGKACN